MMLPMLIVAVLIALLQANPSLDYERLMAQADRLAAPDMYRPGDAVALYRRAATLAEKNGDTGKAARAYDKLGKALADTGQGSRALDALQRAIQLARAAAAKEIESEALRHLATLYHYERRF